MCSPSTPLRNLSRTWRAPLHRHTRPVAAAWTRGTFVVREPLEEIAVRRIRPTLPRQRGLRRPLVVGLARVGIGFAPRLVAAFSSPRGSARRSDGTCPTLEMSRMAHGGVSLSVDPGRWYGRGRACALAG